MEGRSASSTRRATARCCRSCTSTATRSPARPCSGARPTRTMLAPARGPRLRRPRSSRATIRGRCIATSPPRSTRAHAEIRAIQRDARSRRPRLERRAGRRSCCARRRAGPARTRSTALPVEGTFRSHQVPLARRAREPGAPRAARGAGCAATARSELFDRRGRLVPELAALAPEGDRRMGANPHANGGRVLAALDLPDSGRVRARRSPRRRARDARVDAPARRDAARHLRSQRRRAQLPPLLSRRDQLEPARRGLRGREPHAVAAPTPATTTTSRPTGG